MIWACVNVDCRLVAERHAGNRPGWCPGCQKQRRSYARGREIPGWLALELLGDLLEGLSAGSWRRVGAPHVPSLWYGIAAGVRLVHDVDAWRAALAVERFARAVS